MPAIATFCLSCPDPPAFLDIKSYNFFFKRDRKKLYDRFSYLFPLPIHRLVFPSGFENLLFMDLRRIESGGFLPPYVVEKEVLNHVRLAIQHGTPKIAWLCKIERRGK